MVKRTLSFVVLLIAVGTVALLGSRTNAEEPTPITLTNEVQNKISGSLWEGEWYDTGNEVGGDAWLYLIIGLGHVDARITIDSDAAGIYTYRAVGTVKGNTISLVRKGKSTKWLSLSTERKASLF